MGIAKHVARAKCYLPLEGGEAPRRLEGVVGNAIIARIRSWTARCQCLTITLRHAAGHGHPYMIATTARVHIGKLLSARCSCH